MVVMRLALFEPDIAQNAGTMMRLAACLGLAVDLIEPCGFIVGDAKFRRSAMDYLDHIDLVRHSSWAAFQATRLARPEPGRLVVLTTRAERRYIDARFAPDDTILVGRESAGVPDAVHHAADLRLIVPMRPGLRSINVALTAAMVLGEALRQTNLFAEGPAR
jgi:tRNA (cytidine/uridine-2'-O-)-methyltransferase